jgi:hypothetical protein
MVQLTLEGRGFKELYDKHRGHWENAAEGARSLIARTIHPYKPRINDVRDVLLPLMKADPILLPFLNNADRPMIEPYWTSDFTDYALDKVYNPAIQPLRRP